MFRRTLFLPIMIFAAITVVFANLDFIFITSDTITQQLIWRYTSVPATALGSLWFGEIIAALLTPFVLWSCLRIRSLPWTMLGSLTVGWIAYAAYHFKDVPFGTTEMVWRMLHMPMTSRLTMTLDTDWNYLAKFIFLQLWIVTVLVMGSVVSYVVQLMHTRRTSTPQNNAA